MTKLEVFRQVVQEFGDAPAPELVRYIERKFGVVIPPAHVPIFRATLLLQGHPARVQPREQAH